MSLLAEFFSSAEPPVEQEDSLRFHARAVAQQIEDEPVDQNQPHVTGVQERPGRGVSGESSN